MIGVIFGPPGSGKGTQAARMEQAFKLEHLSTGAILRDEVARGTAVGREVVRVMAAGDLVPDHLIEKMVKDRLAGAGNASGVLLDGFPRTLEQARALDALLAGDGRSVDFVVSLEAPERVLVDRILHRASVEGRTDDTREAIAERMREYHKLTAAVLDHYRESGVPVAAVDGVGGVEEVFDRIRAAVPIPPERQG